MHEVTKNWQKSYSVTKGLVPVIDLHKLKNVHDEVFNFSRFQLTTQHVAAIVCVLAAQISPWFDEKNKRTNVSEQHSRVEHDIV